MTTCFGCAWSCSGHKLFTINNSENIYIGLLRGIAYPWCSTRPIRLSVWTIAKQTLYRPRETPRVPAGRGSQISKESAYESGKVVSPTHLPPLPPTKYSRYSFLSETEPTPGPQCGRKIMAMKNSCDNTENRTGDLSGSSAVPQQTTPPRAPLFVIGHT